MNQVVSPHAVLRQAVGTAIARAHLVPLATATRDDLDDHRTAALGDMAEAINRIVPDLGDQWMQALYPELDLSELPGVQEVA